MSLLILGRLNSAAFTPFLSTTRQFLAEASGHKDSNEHRGGCRDTLAREPSRARKRGSRQAICGLHPSSLGFTGEDFS